MACGITDEVFLLREISSLAEEKYHENIESQND